MVGENQQCGTLGHVNRGLWLVASTWNFDDKKVTHVKERKRAMANPPTLYYSGYDHFGGHGITYLLADVGSCSMLAFANAFRTKMNTLIISQLV